MEGTPENHSIAKSDDIVPVSSFANSSTIVAGSTASIQTTHTSSSNVGISMSKREWDFFQQHGGRSLFVRNLPFHFRDEHLRNLIVELLGGREDEVELCRVKYSSEHGKTLQVGVVMLRGEQTATDVLVRLQANPRHGGRDIRAEYFKSAATTEQSHDGTVQFSFKMNCVEPLITEAVVREHFEAEFGALQTVNIRGHFFKPNMQEGYGFMSCMSSRKDAELSEGGKTVERDGVEYTFRGLTKSDTGGRGNKHSRQKYDRSSQAHYAPQQGQQHRDQRQRKGNNSSFHQQHRRQSQAAVDRDGLHARPLLSQQQYHPRYGDNDTPNSQLHYNQRYNQQNREQQQPILSYNHSQQTSSFIASLSHSSGSPRVANAFSQDSLSSISTTSTSTPVAPPVLPRGGSVLYQNAPISSTPLFPPSTTSVMDATALQHGMQQYPLPELVRETPYYGRSHFTSGVVLGSRRPGYQLVAMRVQDDTFFPQNMIFTESSESPFLVSPAYAHNNIHYQQQLSHQSQQTTQPFTNQVYDQPGSSYPHSHYQYNDGASNFLSLNDQQHRDQYLQRSGPGYVSQHHSAQSPSVSLPAQNIPPLVQELPPTYVSKNDNSAANVKNL